MLLPTFKTGSGYNAVSVAPTKWISSKKPTGYGRKNGLYKSGHRAPV